MKRFVFLLLSMICSISAVPVCFGGALGQWTWRNPSTTGNTLTAVAFGTTDQFTNFVAVDNSGSIFSSPDGLNWTERFVGTNALTSVCFGNGNFVAAGGRASGGGVIVLSQDGGTNWSLNYSVTNFLNAVAYGNNEFVAIGNGGATGDASGIDWTNQNNSSVPAGINGIAWGDPPGDFVAVGNGGEIHYTADGVNWNDVTSTGTPYQLNAVAYGGGTIMNGSFGYFVAVGESVIITTLEVAELDGWHTDSTTDFGTAIAYGGSNMFVSVDIDHRPGTFVSTDDGYTFTEANTSYPPPYADGITYGNGYFVEVGSTGQTAISMDASNWTLSASPATTQSLNCGAYRPAEAGIGGSLFVAGGGTFGGSGVILTSPDGTRWALDTNSSVSGYKGILGFTVPSGLVYVSPFFYGVGTEYNGFEDGVSLFSTDGTNWITNSVISNHSLSGLAYGTPGGSGIFVAVGSSCVVPYSTNGTTWVSNGLGSGLYITLNGVTYGNNEFVAVGNSGISAVSADGMKWVTNNYSTTDEMTNFYGVAYGSGLFVAVGGESYDYDRIFTSKDGLRWQQQFSRPTLYSALSGIVYTNGVFVAAGGGGDIFTSPDGTNWTQGISGTINNLSGVVAGDNQILALGADGTILGSDLSSSSPSPPPFANAVYSPAAGFSFTVNGPAGKLVTVESSIDLMHWEVFQTFPQGGTMQVNDPALGAQGKYYRFSFSP